VVTAVWGEEFINLYLDLCVTNQLSPGNLPALPPGSRYRIFTTGEDAPYLAAQSRLDAIRRVLPVDIVAVDMTAADQAARPRERWNTHKRMIACHRRAAADAAPEGRGLIFLAPDFVLGEDTIAGLLRRHGRGARAVMTMNLRLDRDAFLAAARGRGPALAPRALVSLAMRHLHPWTQSLMADSTRTSDNPMSAYWPVRANGALEGVLVRTFFLHPMLVDPVHRTTVPGGPIDSHYIRDCCPDPSAVHVVDDSDELIVFELSPVGREIGGGIDRDGVSPLRLAAVAARCDGHQLSYWTRVIRLHGTALDERWDAAARAASVFAQRVDRYRPYGAALAAMFETLRAARRRREKYAAQAYKLRKRSAKTLSAAQERAPRKARQLTRPVRVAVHRAAKAWALGVKRLRRRVPLFSR
jgi:hypothetical protein